MTGLGFAGSRRGRGGRRLSRGTRDVIDEELDQLVIHPGRPVLVWVIFAQTQDALHACLVHALLEEVAKSGIMDAVADRRLGRDGSARHPVEKKHRRVVPGQQRGRGGIIKQLVRAVGVQLVAAEAEQARDCRAQGAFLAQELIGDARIEAGLSVNRTNAADSCGLTLDGIVALGVGHVVVKTEPERDVGAGRRAGRRHCLRVQVILFGVQAQELKRGRRQEKAPGRAPAWRIGN